MVSSWPYSRLESITVNHDSKRKPVKKLDRKSGPYPYYGASGIADYVDGYIFDGEYLLISEDGENLKTQNTPIAFMATGKFWVNNHAHIVTANDKAITKYLCYCFQATDIHKYLSGTTRPKLTKGDLNRIELPLPPLPAQKAIAHILGTLDDKIELNRKMNQTLEEMARALFKSWFVDFLPVRAKMQARRQTGDPVKKKMNGEPTGLPAEIDRLFPSEMEDSALGKIPQGWRVGKMHELLDISKDSVNPGKIPEEVFAHYSLPAFDDGQRPKLETGDSIKSNKYLLSEETVLLSKLNPHIPRVWFPMLNGEHRPVCSTEFLDVRPGELSSREFLYSYFKSSEFMVEFSSLVTGTSNSHQRIKPDYFLNMDLVIPTKKVIDGFTGIVESSFKKLVNNREENAILEANRDTLLPKLISGEVRVKDAEKFIADV